MINRKKLVFQVGHFWRVLAGNMRKSSKIEKLRKTQKTFRKIMIFILGEIVKIFTSDRPKNSSLKIKIKKNVFGHGSYMTHMGGKGGLGGRVLRGGGPRKIGFPKFQWEIGLK